MKLLFQTDRRKWSSSLKLKGELLQGAAVGQNTKCQEQSRLFQRILSFPNVWIFMKYVGKEKSEIFFLENKP